MSFDVASLFLKVAIKETLGEYKTLITQGKVENLVDLAKVCKNEPFSSLENSEGLPL